MATTFDSVKNFVYSTVLTAPDPAQSGTTLSVQVADGANFPDPASVNDYNLVVFPAGTQPTVANAEIVRVTAKSSNELTITREQESTSARNILVGDQVILAPTAKSIDDIVGALNTVEAWKDSITASAAEINKLDGLTPTTEELNQLDGMVPVSTDGAQTLTNKVLSTGVELDANADPNITYYGMARQAIINGNFDIWQRGTSFAFTTENGYTADRWRKYTSTAGDDVTVSRQDAGTLQGSTYCMRVQRPEGTSATNPIVIQYAMETIDSQKLATNQKLTLSFWAKKGSLLSATDNVLTASIKISENDDDTTDLFFNSGYEVAGTDDFTLTTSWQKFTVTTTDVVVNANQIGIEISYTPTGTAGASDYFEFGQVQLCAGDVALPFQPKSFAEELRACQRYYEKSYEYADAPGSANKYGAFATGIATSTNRIEAIAPYMSRKRVAPTVSIWSFDGTAAKAHSMGSGFSSVGTTVTLDVASVGANEAGRMRLLDSGTGFTADGWYGCHWTASAEL